MYGADAGIEKKGFWIKPILHLSLLPKQTQALINEFTRALGLVQKNKMKYCLIQNLSLNSGVAPYIHPFPKPFVTIFGNNIVNSIPDETRDYHQAV